MILSSVRRMEIDPAVTRWSSPEKITMDTAPVALPVRRSVKATKKSPTHIPVPVNLGFIAAVPPGAGSERGIICPDSV